jgi:hypothetical protein
MIKLREYAKAIAALLGAVATFLVSVNAPAEWSVYLGSVVALLTGIATFGIPNVKVGPAAQAPVDQAIGSIQQTVQDAVSAASDLDKLRQAATDALANAPVIGPVLGPLATQVINSLPRI